MRMRYIQRRKMLLRSIPEIDFETAILSINCLDD
jgi:hypothetical protein